MKYLLIIISILLLSNPVIGNKQKGETLYVLGEYPDWKWVEFGDKKTQPKYQGQVKDGKLSTGIFYDKNQNISFKVVNGRMIKQ